MGSIQLKSIVFNSLLGSFGISRCSPPLRLASSYSPTDLERRTATVIRPLAYARGSEKVSENGTGFVWSGGAQQDQVVHNALINNG